MASVGQKVEPLTHVFRHAIHYDVCVCVCVCVFACAREVFVCVCVRGSSVLLVFVSGRLRNWRGVVEHLESS